jgi:hypothetical protein
VIDVAHLDVSVVVAGAVVAGAVPVGVGVAVGVHAAMTKAVAITVMADKRMRIFDFLL